MEIADFPPGMIKGAVKVNFLALFFFGLRHDPGQIFKDQRPHDLQIIITPYGNDIRHGAPSSNVWRISVPITLKPYFS